MRNLVAVLASLILFASGCGSPGLINDSKTNSFEVPASPIPFSISESVSDSNSWPPEDNYLRAPVPNPDWKYEMPVRGVPILMYHSIANLPGNDLGVPPEKFNLQMKYLHDEGFSTINFEILLEGLSGKAVLPRKPIIITFDDGYTDNYTAAFPVLKLYDFNATVFMITGEIDKVKLSHSQIVEMHSNGIAFQSHTVNHPDLRTLGLADQRIQLLSSKSALEELLGSKVDVFCFPSGKYDQNTFVGLKESGYTAAVTTDYGNVKSGDDPLKLKRIRINGSDSLEAFKLKLGK